MAGTLVLLVVVCLTALWQSANGQMVPCAAMDQCREIFREQAQTIGHEKETLCQLLKDELKCYEVARPTCNDEQKPYAQNQIQNAQKDRTYACGATWIEASHWLMTVSAILAVVYHRRF